MKRTPCISSNYILQRKSWDISTTFTLIKSSVVVMPIVSPWYTCFGSSTTRPLVFYPAWNLGSLSCNTSYMCVCVCMSICVQAAKVLETNASLWCVQLILYSIEEKQMQSTPRTVKVLLGPFWSLHGRDTRWCVTKCVVSIFVMPNFRHGHKMAQEGSDCRNCAQYDCCGGQQARPHAVWPAHEPLSLCTPGDHRIRIAASRTCMLTAVLWHLHFWGRRFPPPTTQYLTRCPQYLARCTAGAGVV